MLLQELTKTQNSALSTQHWAFTIDLQMFADDEKTEKATPRKREQARKKGQVLHSKEVNTAAILLALFLTIKYASPYIYNEFVMYFNKVFTSYMNGDIQFDQISEVMKFTEDTIVVFLRIMAPILVVALFASLLSGYAQIGFLFTVETLQFKLEKLNPISGFKRMFSKQSVVELLKSVIKIVIAIYIAYLYLKGEVSNVILLMDMDVMHIFMYIGNLAINVSIAIIIALIVLAIFDYIFQWWEYENNLKMSKQELKEEYKQTEGNPQIKAKIKQKQRQMSASRMMKEIPKADVIIANPTHFAVALKYDQSEGEAPIVIAKGQDYVALRIKDIAKENSVEIVENKPLARTLYSTVDIGEPIPEELYQTVAEILAFVYKLKQKNVAG
jgi:flagellar biosynthetic protein FlhB